MNKEIYIDGVDVSGCGWYTQGATGMICACWHLSSDCCKNPNCDYKQFKRLEKLLPDINGKFYKAVDDLQAKEQECEEWKHQAELGIDTTNRLTKELKETEEECERLKNELLTYGATGICEVCTDKSVLQNDKYTKALREIKEIVEKAQWDYRMPKEVWDLILQKCEVLNDR